MLLLSSALFLVIEVNDITVPITAIEIIALTVVVVVAAAAIVEWRVSDVIEGDISHGVVDIEWNMIGD